MKARVIMMSSPKYCPPDINPAEESPSIYPKNTLL